MFSVLFNFFVMLYILNLYSVLLFFSVRSFFYFKNSLLFSLLRLELITLFVLYVCCMVINVYSTSIVLICFFLCFAARGAAVGLSLLVGLRRLYGNDIISTFPFEKNSRGRFVFGFAKTSKYFYLVEHWVATWPPSRHADYNGYFFVIALYCWHSFYL